MEQKVESNSAPPGGATRRSFVSGTLAGTAAGVLAGGVPGALAKNDKDKHSHDRHDRNYGLPKGKYRIDLHSHFLPPDYTAFLRSKGSVTFPWTLDGQLTFMDTWNIQKSVVSVPIGFHFGNVAETKAVARNVNEYGKQLLEDHGDRFGVHVTLPMPDVTASIEELNYAVDTLKLDGGVMLFAHYGGVYLGDAMYDPLWAEFDKRKMQVWVHPGATPVAPFGPIPGPLEVAFETTRAAAHLIYRGVLDRFPNIKWQLSHGGGTLPYMMTRLSFSQEQGFGFTFPKRPKGPEADAKKFIYDTALAFGDEQLVTMDALVRTDQIIFGTDYPFTGSIHAADAATKMPYWTDSIPNQKTRDTQPQLSNVFKRKERLDIERGNARRLYPKVVPAKY